MARVNNPVIGRIECEACGSECEVRQARRGGNHLYTVCPECRADQRTGKTLMRRLWTQTYWYDDVDPVRPPNVPPDVPRGTLKAADFSLNPAPTIPPGQKEPGSPSAALPATNKWTPLALLGAVGAVIMALAH